jgi:hypothetical protein
MPEPEFDYRTPDTGGLNSGRIWPKRLGSDRIRKIPAEIRPFWPDPVKLSPRNPATFAKLSFLHFVIFSCEPNTEKYFRKNYFF